MGDEASGGDLGGRLTAGQVRQEQNEIARSLEAARTGAAKDGVAETPEPEPILKEWIGLLVRAAFWALLIYQFVFQVSVVNGSSMEPNIHHGDRLLIDKVVYRLRKPAVGDPVVFEAVVRDGGRLVVRDYIKRVVAGPGSEVRIFNGRVMVDGRMLDESAWDPAPFGYDADLAKKVFVVPPKRYFVLGDNRVNSEDSRGNRIGFVHEAQIKGKVRWRFWPFEQLAWY